MRLLLLIYILTFAFNVDCQTSINELKDINLVELDIQLREGKKQALRDLGSFLDKSNYQKEAKSIILDNTLFTTEEINKAFQSKASFLSFYYDNEDRILYDDLSKVFYLTDFQDQKSKYKINYVEEEKMPDKTVLLEKYILAFNNAVETLNEKEIEKNVRLIAWLNVKEGYRFLIKNLKAGVFENKKLKNNDQITLFTLKLLVNYQHLECLETILYLFNKNSISEKITKDILAELTNLLAPEHINIDRFYQNKLDSLETIEKMRARGYEIAHTTRPIFFEHPVDYYATILHLSRKIKYLRRNAVRDMLKTKHPRSLFYVSCIIYKNRKNRSIIQTQDLQIIANFLNNQTRQELLVADQNGNFQSDPRKWDNEARKNCLLFWANHYPEYEWDKNQKLFINKIKNKEKTDDYEKLFRRLTSENDSVAWHSFIQLTEGGPATIASLTEKYRQLFRDLNPNLPSIKYNYLEALSSLTSYCKKNSISYKPNSILEEKLEKLVQANQVNDILKVENELIQHLTLNTITAFEYWVIINAKNKKISFSAARIIDHVYSNNWQKVIFSNEALRLYLKKSRLFQSIGVDGICNQYLEKFDITDFNVSGRIQELETIEADLDILGQIFALTKNNKNKESNLNDFLNDPLSYDKDAMKNLQPTKSFITKLFKKIKNENDEKSNGHLFTFIEIHANDDFTEDLIELLEDDRSIIDLKNDKYKINKKVVAILNQLYHNAYNSVEGWQAFCWKQSIPIKKWSLYLFNQRVEQIQLKKELDIKEVNDILKSELLTQKQQIACLMSIEKIRPIRHLKRLKLENLKLSDLSYFEKIDFTYKDLDDIPKFFQIDDYETIFNFIDEKSKDFNIDEKGSFYNNIFRQLWFAKAINENKIDANRANKIKDILTQYLNASEFISNFEEQATNLHILQIGLLNQPIIEKLKALNNLTLDQHTANKIRKEFIAQISYEELPLVLDQLNEQEWEHPKKVYYFLQNDFGIPLNDFSKEQLLQLTEDIKTKTPKDLYLTYLTKMGVDILKDGDLDFAKIHKHLQFDIVSSFIEYSGEKRDWYGYTLVKILEYHFDDRLGFHEKLNESQNFFAHNAVKRANIWSEYLEKQGFVKPNPLIPGSFNQIVNKN